LPSAIKPLYFVRCDFPSDLLRDHQFWDESFFPRP
jgi:hypothetical protein